MWKEWWLAAGFLTRIPMPTLSSVTEQDVGKSARFFPAIGLVIGSLSFLVAFAVANLFSKDVAAWVTLLFMTVITGGLHLDGLMDTFDGVLSSRSRERMLEIMKDSRVGAMGVLAAIFVLGGKYIGLTNIPYTHWFDSLMIVPMASRALMMVAIIHYSYARIDGGTGTAFARYLSIKDVMASVFLIVLVAGAIGHLTAIITIISMTFFSWLFAEYLNRKLGGLTGDTYGAINEIAELIGYILYGTIAIHL